MGARARCGVPSTHGVDLLPSGGEAGKGRGPFVAQQRMGRSARNALRVPHQINRKSACQMRGIGRRAIHAWRGSTDLSGGTSPSVEGLPRQGRGEAGNGRGPFVAQQRMGRSARSALRVPRQINKKGRPKGSLFYLSGGERGIVGCIHAPDPDARCASGPACGCPVLLLQNRRTPAGLLTAHPIRQTNAKGPPYGRPFCVCLAERGGFEPPKRGLDAYTLSRRAPSTTRTPLRIPAIGKRLSRGADSSGRRGHTQAPPVIDVQWACRRRGGWTGMAQWNIRWKTVA